MYTIYQSYYGFPCENSTPISPAKAGASLREAKHAAAQQQNNFPGGKSPLRNKGIKGGCGTEIHSTLSILRHFIFAAIVISITGCATQQKMITGSSVNKENLRNAYSGKDVKLAVNVIRAQSLRDTALSLGARGGLAHRAHQLNSMTLSYEKSLNRVFQFHGMLLDDNVVPPVLIEAKNTLSLTGDDIIRIADRNYSIIQQAKFVTAPPTWRDYLWMVYTDPSLPDKSLLPRNKAEQNIWEKYIDEGWEAGLLQAELIFRENLNRIRRDYEGMILYRKLLMQNMVSPPFVAAMDLGITGDKNNMTINDRVLRITAFPSLQTNGEGWKTEIYAHE